MKFNAPPYVQVATAEQQARLAELRKDLDAATKTVADLKAAKLAADKEAEAKAAEASKIANEKSAVAAEGVTPENAVAAGPSVPESNQPAAAPAVNPIKLAERRA